MSAASPPGHLGYTDSRTVIITDLGLTAEQIQSVRGNVMKHVEERSLSQGRTCQPRRVSARRIPLIASGAELVAAALIVTSADLPGRTKMGTAANAAEFRNTA